MNRRNLKARKVVKALEKFGWVLGHEEWAKDKNEIKEKMLENISGELNSRLEE